jgi:L-fuculose-phosphate aldolase
MSDPRNDLLKAAKQISEAGLVTGCAGNISVRLPGGRVLIKAAGARLGDMGPNSLSVIDMAGNIVEAGPAPSTEYRVHLAIYAARPDVNAIVHTHSVYASVLGYFKEPLLDINPETTEVVGEVGFVPRLPHGTEELADAVAAALKTNNAALMIKHGPIVVASTMAEAVDRACYLEEAAEMTYLIKRAGD